MRLTNEKGHIYIPDGLNEEAALRRTTHLCVAAHQDDVEIMSYGAIAECYGKEDKWFAAAVVTDGAGSPRAGEYASMTDEEMQAVRSREQDEAAALGRYAFMAQLGYPSAAAKSAGDGACAAEIASLIKACAPETVLTHNLADKHDTHVGVALRVLEAVRALPRAARPKKLVSLEVWRGLDWLRDEDKEVFDTSPEPALAEKLLSVFKSQCAGGKRYDLAALGRRLANATFFASHAVDSVSSCSYGLDITALMDDESLDPARFMERHIEALRADVFGRLARVK